MQSGIFPPLNTKADYYLMIQTHSSKYKQVFQDLLDTRVQWVKTNVLNSTSEGIVDATHKIVIVPRVGGGRDIYQYVLEEDTNAKMYKLGFEVSEIYNILNG